MTEFRFSITPKEKREFESAYYSELAVRWAPYRLFSFVRALFAVAAAALFFVVIPGPERAVAVMAGAFFLFWGFQSAMQKISSIYYERYLASFPDIDQYCTFIDGDFLYMENRGIRNGYPLAKASKPYADKTYLYVDFPRVGRFRIPLSAFPDDDARDEFERTICEKMESRSDEKAADEGSLIELRKPSECPQCGEARVKRIIYGTPCAEGWVRIEAGEACQGPDFVRPWLPDWHCPACGHEWFVASDPGKQRHELELEWRLEKNRRESA